MKIETGTYPSDYLLQLGFEIFTGKGCLGIWLKLPYTVKWYHFIYDLKQWTGK